jgi:xanthine dehydrogenase accessory factor
MGEKNLNREKNLIEKAIGWINKGHGVSIATVISTWGSSPRPIGSQLVVNDREAFFGSVSGGCIESTILTEAQFVIRNDKPQRLSIGIDRKKAWDYGLGCGGIIDVYVEPVASWQPILLRMSDLIVRQQPFCLITDLSGGSKELFCPNLPGDSFRLDDELRTFAEGAIDLGQSRLVKQGRGDFFLHVFLPPPQMIIGGAVHIAQPLVAMAQLLDYQCSIIDPRTTYATEQRFPEVALVVEHPKTALKNIRLHPGSAVVALTHSPQFDDPLLIHALNSNADYIGALGSRKTHEDRMNRLRKKGITNDQLIRIHGPVGLDIGSRTPAEIALSIMGQITQIKRATNCK